MVTHGLSGGSTLTCLRSLLASLLDRLNALCGRNETSPVNPKTEYVTVRESVFENFDEHINKLLAEGYSLHGSPYVVVRGQDAISCQALTRTVRIEPKQVRL